MKLSMLGPPGSGKTTQAELVSETFGLAHVYAGDALRNEAEGDSPIAERVRSHIDAGLLVPSDIVILVIERELEQAGGRYVLDGFPRIMEQALELEFLLRKRGESLDAVVYLSITDDEVMKRLLERGRSDDTPEVIGKRIEVFHTETDAVLRFYDEMNILLEVSGIGSISEVTDNVLGTLQTRFNPDNA